MTARVVFDESRQRVPVFVWSRQMERETLRQLQVLASEPYVVEHIAAMPDAHVASGVAVGTVFVTDHAIVPAALGSDIGCGMRAVAFDVEAASLGEKRRRRLLSALGRVIPVGHDVHRGDVEFPGALFEKALSTGALEHARERLLPRHLGTLGGGNHFVELDRDGEGRLWLLLHTGSRGLGGAIAQHHAAAARSTKLGGQLGALDVREPEGQRYFSDMTWAIAFARANRDAICSRAIEVIAEETGASVVPGSEVDLEHNFAQMECVHGRPRIVHRKGAAPAERGRLGLIPGSMGTASYLVQGLGSEDAFASSAHGAGRVMSRATARRAIRPHLLERSMGDVVFDRGRLAALVEEAPAAYRDIREVLQEQEDLVVPVARLEPLLVLKG